MSSYVFVHCTDLFSNPSRFSFLPEIPALILTEYHLLLLRFTNLLEVSL